MPQITIEYDGTAVREALNRLAAGVSPGGLRAPLSEIGEVVAESTKQRFVTNTAPDGSRWVPNAMSVYLRLIGRKDRRKDGRINARGTAKAANKRPLVDTGLLAESIRWQLMAGDEGVEIGTNRFAGEWPGGAAVHQFGSRDGRIPARPFLGLSSEDEREVLNILQRYLDRLTPG